MNNVVPKRLTIGIVAGCCPRHEEVRVGGHFQEVLATLVRKEYQVELVPVVEPSWGMPAPWRVSVLAADGADCVLIQTRTLFLINNAELIPRVLRQAKTCGQHTQGESSVEDGDATSPSSRTLRCRLVITATRAVQPMNLALGMLSGAVARRAVRTELEQVLVAIEVATQRELPICIIGATIPEKWSWLGRRVCRTVNDALARATHEWGISYVDLEPGWVGTLFLMPDGYHLSTAGHRFVAGRVLDACRDWLTSPREYTEDIRLHADQAGVSTGGW